MLRVAESYVLVLALMGHIKCTVVPPSAGDSFKQCLITMPSGSFGYCLGVGAISKLRNWDDSPEFDIVDGLTLSRDGKQYREEYNYVERDPNDLRSIMDSFGKVLSSRSMRWDMSFIYPGLAMRVAPSTSPGGQLEFVLDPHREANFAHSLKEAGTARVLARQFLVPLLLGFKFNIATLIPIIFGLLALIAKKAVFLSKIALIASSALGLGSLLLSNNYYGHKPHYGSFNPGFAGHHHYNRYPDDEYDALYRGGNANYNEDQLHLYGNVDVNRAPSAVFPREEKQINGRNFVWAEEEKTKQ